MQLRPHDARMWNAMGHCYQQDQLAMYDAAIRCHRRALPYDRWAVGVGWGGVGGLPIRGT